MPEEIRLKGFQFLCAVFLRLRIDAGNGPFMLILSRVFVQVTFSRRRGEQPALLRLSTRFPFRFQCRVDGGDHWEHTTGSLRFSVCDLYKPTSAVQMDILPSEAERFARAHACAANNDCSITPRLRTLCDVSLPIGIRKNRVPLPFALRQRECFLGASIWLPISLAFADPGQ